MKASEARITAMIWLAAFAAINDQALLALVVFVVALVGSWFLPENENE